MRSCAFVQRVHCPLSSRSLDFSRAFRVPSNLLGMHRRRVSKSLTRTNLYVEASFPRRRSCFVSTLLSYAEHDHDSKCRVQAPLCPDHCSSTAFVGQSVEHAFPCMHTNACVTSWLQAMQLPCPLSPMNLHDLIAFTFIPAKLRMPEPESFQLPGNMMSGRSVHFAGRIGCMQGTCELWLLLAYTQVVHGG